MKVTTSQLKSLIKESVREIMEEQVKGIDIEGHKNLTITSGHSFDDLPEWFQKAKTENAKVELKNGDIAYFSGYWLGGNWKAKGGLADGSWSDDAKITGKGSWMVPKI